MSSILNLECCWVSLHGGESVINWQGISVKKVVRQVCAGNLYTSTEKSSKRPSTENNVVAEKRKPKEGVPLKLERRRTVATA